VVPGFVDAHVHSGLRAGAAAGRPDGAAHSRTG
jgi:cytosine/adenosine deaminase-related metal-dependent hydrolase